MTEPLAPTIDLDRLVAIDVHTHVHRSVSAPAESVDTEISELANYFRTQPVSFTVDDLAAAYREREPPGGTSSRRGSTI